MGADPVTNRRQGRGVVIEELVDGLRLGLVDADQRRRPQQAFQVDAAPCDRR